MRLFCVWVLLAASAWAVRLRAKPALIQQASSNSAADALSTYLSRYSTPEGQIAAALELLNSNIISTSDQITQESSLLFQKLSQAVELISEAVNAILEDEIFQRQSALNDYREEIQEVEIQINDAAGTCALYAGCLACAQDQACVWCSALGRCVTGDQNGPLNNECEDFTYRECPQRSCSEYTGCMECMTDSTCEWCIGGIGCGDAGTTSCDSSFLVREVSGGSCPVTDEQLLASYITQVPANLPDSRLPAIQSQLLDLESQAALLRDEINLLETSQAQITASAADAETMVTSGNYTFADIEGLASSVEELALAEEAARREAMNQAVSDTAQAISTRITDYVLLSNAERLQQVQGQSQSIVDIQSRTLDTLSNSGS